LCGDRVHSICWWTNEDFVAPGDAETAEEGIDCFIAADAYKEVFWSERFRGVDVGVAEVYEELFEGGLVRVGIPVQAKEID
jgi:hypothetical protein